MDIVERLNGVYRTPITDGLGPAGGEEPDNPNEFVRTFQTPPIQKEAAATITALRKRVEELEGALEPFARAGTELPDDRVITEGHPEWQRCLRRFKITVSELTVRQFHRARAALRAKGGDNGNA